MIKLEFFCYFNIIFIYLYYKINEWSEDEYNERKK